MTQEKPNGENGNGFVLEFDEAKAVKVLSSLAREWRDRDQETSRFFGHVSPEVQLAPPEFRQGGSLYGSVAHALWLFFCGFLNRSGSDAHWLIGQLATIWKTNPWAIDPSSRPDHPYEDYLFLREVIPFGADKVCDRVQWWIDALDILRIHFDDDPRLILTANRLERYVVLDEKKGHNIEVVLTNPLTGDPMADRQEIIRRFSQFPGIGPKITQLIVGWLQEVEWLNPPTGWELVNSIPVVATDIWVGRLARQTLMVTEWSNDHSQTILPKLSDRLCEICSNRGINHSEAIQGIWHAGAVFCGKLRPRDPRIAFENFCPFYCPLAGFCHGVVPANVKTTWSEDDSLTEDNGQIELAFDELPLAKRLRKVNTRLSQLLLDGMVVNPNPRREHLPRLLL